MKTLYKRDSKGKVREWRMERSGGSYRTIAGLADGQQVTSEWTEAVPKNVGKANATTAEEQAQSEIDAAYVKKLRMDYHESIDDIDKPLYFKPMLATTWEKRAAKIDWNKPVYCQPKLDGIRCIATSRGLFTRTGKAITAVPHIVEALAPLFEDDPELILDGELYNHALKDDFNSITSMVRKAKPKPEELALAEQMVEYHIYDVPSEDGIFSVRFDNLKELLNGKVVYRIPASEWRKMTDEEQRESIRKNTVFADGVENDAESCLKRVPTVKALSIEFCDKFHGVAIENGYEGTMIRLDEPYQQKRSNNLIKRKDFEDAEFEILRIEEGLGNWSGVAKRVFFKNDLDGREVGAGLAGSREYAKEVLDNADAYVGKKVTIQFFTRTPDGVPRFPIAKILHLEDRI